MFRIRGVRNMSFYLLEYKFVPDILTKRAPFREEHLSYAKDSKQVVLGGALDPPERGILVLDSPSRESAEAFAKNDPYVLNGLVPSYSINPWNVAIDSTSRS